MKNKKQLTRSVKSASIDEYHDLFPKATREKLDDIRETIKKTAPEAIEVISYGMPAFKGNKVLVYYAAYNAHIGFYPTSSPIINFKKDLARFKTSKGAIQFPLDKPLPTGIIKKIVKYRVREDEEKSKTKTKSNPILHQDIRKYNDALPEQDKKICSLLAREINNTLTDAESKIWHAHPVWFYNGNPVAGYHKLKNCVRLLFWSGQSFNEPGLDPEGTFKAAEARYTNVDEINTKDLKRWLQKARKIQWDYKNIIKRRGVLEKLTKF